jgi:hypothetical protein
MRSAAVAFEDLGDALPEVEDRNPKAVAILVLHSALHPARLTSSDNISRQIGMRNRSMTLFGVMELLRHRFASYAPSETQTHSGVSASKDCVLRELAAFQNPFITGLGKVERHILPVDDQL